MHQTPLAWHGWHEVTLAHQAYPPVEDCVSALEALGGNGGGVGAFIHCEMLVGGGDVLRGGEGVPPGGGGVSNVALLTTASR